MSSAPPRLTRLATATLAALAAAGARAEGAEPGPAASAFVWRPEIALTSLYDTNIYAIPRHAIDDWLGTLSPTVSGESQWDRHRIRVDAGAELGRYADHASEDYDDWWVNADGRYDLGAGSTLFGGMGFAQEHEERGSPDAVAPAADPAVIDAEPTVYTSLTAQGGMRQRFGANVLRAGATFEQLDYDDVPSLAGSTVDNDDRDRRVVGVAVRLSRRLDSNQDLFVQAQWNERRYDQAPDDWGYERDSAGYRLAIGLEGELGPGVGVEGYVGYLNQDYDDPRFDTVAGLDFAGKLNWRVDGRTRARLTLERNVNETTLEGASSYLYTNLEGSLSHQLGDRATLSADLSAGLAEYQDVGRDDWIYGGGLTAQYRISPRVYLTGGYRLAIRDSDERGGTGPSGHDPYDYDRQQVFLTLSVLGAP